MSSTATRFSYISWGAGLQSTTLVAMAVAGGVAADAIIFADTQDEPEWVYETLWYWRSRSRNIPIYVPSKGSLSEALRDKIENGKRFANLPLWTAGTDGRAAPLLRQCTREWKIEVIAREVRRILGYQHGQRVTHDVRCLLGISLDEAGRMRPNRYAWQVNEYPLIERRMKRGDCEAYLTERGIPVPRRSSCRYCPYHSDSYWRDLKENYPDEFERACKVDDLVRGMSERGTQSPVFVHRSLVPLRRASFGESQMDFFTEECSGSCGV